MRARADGKCELGKQGFETEFQMKAENRRGENRSLFTKAKSDKALKQTNQLRRRDCL